MRGSAQELSPVSRVLLALEAIQNQPGITAGELGTRLGVTERAARRHVALLREAGIPIESLRGPYGGYRAGRGMRLAPLMLTRAEALGLGRAVLEGHRAAADPAELVGGALAKLIRALPDRVADPVRGALREHRSAAAAPCDPLADPPEHLDALRTLEEHFSQGWGHPVDVVIDAPVDEVSSWLPRSLGRLEPHSLDAEGAAAERGRTRLRATTDEPDWYARHLASIPAPFRVLGSEPVRAAVAALARKLAAASADPDMFQGD